MKKQSNLPELRFPSFKDDWEIIKGEVVFESVSNKNHNSDLPILAITQEHGAIPRNLISYNISVTDQSIGSYKVVEKGNFIISLRSFQGGIEYSDYNGICSPAYIILKPIKEIDRTFFKYYFKTPRYIKRLTKNLEGIRDGKMISFKYFSEAKITFPTIPEQKSIASFFTALDKKIAELKQKRALLIQYKKGVMQKIFSQELQFKDDKGKEFPAWEVRRFGDYFIERNEKATEDIPLYSLTIENGITPKSERYERSFLVNDNNDAYKKMYKNDFAFNPMNLRFGALARHKDDNVVSVSKYYNIFYCNEKGNSSFFEYYLTSFDLLQYYNKMATGSLVEKKRVHYLDFIQFRKHLPSLAEQTKIAAFFSALDIKINCTEKQISQTQQYKKGLLQNMFI